MGNTCSGRAAPTRVSRCDVGRCVCAACARVPVCVCVCVCARMCVRACSGLAPGQPRTLDRAGISARAALAYPPGSLPARAALPASAGAPH